MIKGLPLVFEVLIADAAGSAANFTIGRRGKIAQLQKRRRGVVPKGAAPAYWREVYVLVELIWNNMSEADKDTWRYGWKRPGDTGRDSFGHWNMNLVGRWGVWLRQHPGREFYTARVTDWPGSEALPPWANDCLPGAWQSQTGWAPFTQTYRRYGLGWGATRNGAWNMAKAALLAAPWAPSVAMQPRNRGELLGDWSGYNAEIWQVRASVERSLAGVMTWRGPELTIWGQELGEPAGQLPWTVGPYQMPAGQRRREVPEFRTKSPPVAINWQVLDAGNWAVPPQPSPTATESGWVCEGVELAYEWRR